MDEDGEVQRLWMDFHQTLRSVREMKVCSSYLSRRVVCGRARLKVVGFRMIVRSETFSTWVTLLRCDDIQFSWHDSIYSYTL